MDDELIDLGPEQLLESGRLGRQVAMNRSDKPVFVDTQGKLCCRHGERAATIQEWIAKERLDPSFLRPTRCDCANVDGLLTDYRLQKAAFRPVEAPLPRAARLAKLYKLLGTMGAEEKVVNTRPQRKALTSAEGDVWVQPAGTLVCVHGNTVKPLAKIAKMAKITVEADQHRTSSFKRKAVVFCACLLKVPRRRGSVFAVASKAPPEWEAAAAAAEEEED